MSNRNIKRVMKDIRKFEESKFDDIFIHYEESDMQHIFALIIGPKDTLFAGGFFYFSLDMTLFPEKPPAVKFLTPYRSGFRLHPNLYSEGKVCLDILNTWAKNAWSSMLTLEKILITIQTLLDNNPIANEPAYYSLKESDKRAVDYAVMSRYLTMCSVPVMLNRTDIPAPFKEVMSKYIESNREVYLKSFEVLDAYKSKRVSTLHGCYVVNNYRFDV